jgi:hypothetical protein
MRNQALDRARNWAAAGKEDRTSQREIGSRQPVEDRTDFSCRMPMRTKIGAGAPGATFLPIQHAVSIQ